MAAVSKDSKARFSAQGPRGNTGHYEVTPGTRSRHRSLADERFLRNAIELGATSSEAELSLGVLLSRRGLWRDALPHLRRSIELGGEKVEAYYYLGEALNCVDDLAGALSAFEKARDLDPENERALRGLGVVYDRLGRSEEAVEMYHRSQKRR